MTTKQVTTSMTFEVTVHLSATETADENGADISNVQVDGIDVNGVPCRGYVSAITYMNNAAQKGDWTDE